MTRKERSLPCARCGDFFRPSMGTKFCRRCDSEREDFVISGRLGQLLSRHRSWLQPLSFLAPSMLLILLIALLIPTLKWNTANEIAYIVLFIQLLVIGFSALFVILNNRSIDKPSYRFPVMSFAVQFGCGCLLATLYSQSSFYFGAFGFLVLAFAPVVTIGSPIAALLYWLIGRSARGAVSMTELTDTLHHDRALYSRQSLSKLDSWSWRFDRFRRF